MASYPYDWTDFPDGEPLCCEKLTARVEAEAAITTALDAVSTDGEAETVIFDFADTLAGAEVTALDAIVAGYECETLAELKLRRIGELDTVTREYMTSRYPSHDLDLWNGILTDAVANGLTNRAAYVGGILGWAMSLSVGYFDPKKTAINAAADKAAVEAVTFSAEDCASTFDPSDPGATIAAALAIED